MTKIIDENKIQKHLDYQAKMLDLVEESFINTQEKLLANEPVLVLMDKVKQEHAHARSFQRCVSYKNTLEVLKTGIIIEASKSKKEQFRLVLCGFVTISTGETRPIHLVCEYNTMDESIIIVTVYDPRPNEDYSEPRWRNNYMERVFYK